MIALAMFCKSAKFTGPKLSELDWKNGLRTALQSILLSVFVCVL